MLHIILITIPEPYNSELRKIQTQFKDPNWTISLPPHITIVPPFSTDLSEYRLTEAISNLLKSSKSLKIDIGKVDKFDNVFGTVYQSIEKTEALVKLYVTLNDGLVEKIKIDNYPKTFIPHVTLSGDIPKTNMDNKFSLINNLTKRTNFTCREIDLWHKTPEDKYWIKDRSFDLN